MVMCPENITTAAVDEITNVSWPEPIFMDSLGLQLNITSTFGTNVTTLDWGEHRVEYIATNTHNNRKTACVFYIEIARKSELTEW